MKTVNAHTDKGNIAEYFIDVNGDIFEPQEEAQLLGLYGKVIVDGFYFGTPEEMKASALRKWHEGKK